jgi:hypothetical protein
MESSNGIQIYNKEQHLISKSHEFTNLQSGDGKEPRRTIANQEEMDEQSQKDRASLKPN